MKTVNDFIKELNSLKLSLKDKPIIIVAPNGLKCEPKIKLELKEEFNPESGVNNLIITYE